jgi:hypothetical protein
VTYAIRLSLYAGVKRSLLKQPREGVWVRGLRDLGMVKARHEFPDERFDRDARGVLTPRGAPHPVGDHAE